MCGPSPETAEVTWGETGGQRPGRAAAGLVTETCCYPHPLPAAVFIIFFRYLFIFFQVAGCHLKMSNNCEETSKG